MRSSPWTLLMPWQLQRATRVGSCWMQVPRAGTAAWGLYLPWLCEPIPREPSWGFSGSTGTPRHHFHRYSQQSPWHSLHGGLNKNLRLSPRWHSQLCVAPPRWHRWLELRTRWHSPPKPHPRLQSGFRGVQPALTAARSPPRVVFHGMAAGPAQGPAPRQSVRWAERLNPKLTHGDLCSFTHP